MANEKKLQCYGFVDKVINSSFAPLIYDNLQIIFNNIKQFFNFITKK